MTEQRSFAAADPPPGIRDALLAAARDEFLTHGFRDASMRRVASTAGCAVGSIYVHFSSKDDLFDAVVGPGEEAFWTFYDALEERDAAIATKDISFEQALEEERALTSDMFEFIAERSQDMSLLMLRAEGSSRAGFRERLTERFSAMYTRMLAERSMPDGLTFDAFRMFSLPLVDLLERLSSGSVDREAALMQADLIARFNTAGWNALLDLWPSAANAAPSRTSTKPRPTPKATAP